MKKFTKEEFILKSQKHHGNLYDYSKVIYKNGRTPIIIICSIHGEFNQTPFAHMGGQGCPRCGGTGKKNLNLFIEDANKIHSNKYEYLKSVYINNKIKLIIICKDHGEFLQTPNSHLRGRGCPQCKNIKIRMSNIKTFDEFINDAIKVHSNKYDYSLVEYKGDKKKVIIVCKKHGKFNQLAYAHLKGQGCPKCAESKGETKIRLFLEENNLKYIQEKRFKYCKDKNYLPFDFYLPDYNLCIEYDGEHHFFSYKRSKKITDIQCYQNLEYIQNHDKIKNDYCKNNNIDLLRIPYWEFKNTNELLKFYFEKNTNLYR